MRFKIATVAIPQSLFGLVIDELRKAPTELVKSGMQGSEYRRNLVRALNTAADEPDPPHRITRLEIAPHANRVWRFTEGGAQLFHRPGRHWPTLVQDLTTREDHTPWAMPDVRAKREALRRLRKQLKAKGLEYLAAILLQRIRFNDTRGTAELHPLPGDVDLVIACENACKPECGDTVPS